LKFVFHCILCPVAGNLQRPTVRWLKTCAVYRNLESRDRIHILIKETSLDFRYVSLATRPQRAYSRSRRFLSIFLDSLNSTLLQYHSADAVKIRRTFQLRLYKIHSIIFRLNFSSTSQKALRNSTQKTKPENHR